MGALKMQKPANEAARHIMDSITLLKIGIFLSSSGASFKRKSMPHNNAAEKNILADNIQVIISSNNTSAFFANVY